MESTFKEEDFDVAMLAYDMLVFSDDRDNDKSSLNGLEEQSKSADETLSLSFESPNALHRSYDIPQPTNKNSSSLGTPRMASQVYGKSALPSLSTRDSAAAASATDTSCSSLSFIQNSNSEANVKPQLEPVSRVNFSKQTRNVWNPLTRPLFHENRIVLGTEYPLGRGPENPGISSPGIDFGVCKVPWTDPEFGNHHNFESNFVGTEYLLTDLQWVVPGELCIYASEQDVQLCRRDLRRTLIERLPRGQDGSVEVRQLATCGNRVAMGDSGHTLTLYEIADGRMRTLFKDRLNDTVGSVAWSPTLNNIVTFTLDNGTFGLMDVRENTPKTLFSRNFKWGAKSERLFTHCEFAPYNFVLGYEGGKVRSIDVRRQANDQQLVCWADPYLEDIGELIRPSPDSSITVACGIGGFSVWDFKDNTGVCLDGVKPLASLMDVPLPSGAYKTSGAFIPGSTSLFALTDAAGYLSFYDLSRFERHNR